MFKELLQVIKKKITISLEKWAKGMNRLFINKIIANDRNTRIDVRLLSLIV